MFFSASFDILLRDFTSSELLTILYWFYWSVVLIDEVMIEYDENPLDAILGLKYLIKSLYPTDLSSYFVKTTT